jgi:ribosome biogenesis GTPase
MAPITGIVLSGAGGQWRVRTERGDEAVATLRGKVKHEAGLKLAVGDLVHLEGDGRDPGLTITAILPRTSQLARRNPTTGRGERIVAANIDQVVVVLAMAKPEPNERMLDRFLVIAEADDLPARVVINKIDLAGKAQARERFAAYDALGYPIHLTSIITGDGLDALHDALRGSTSVLTGPSGVGKSSLMNTMYPGLDLRVASISESVNKGRHTTVGAHLHPLPDGGYVMDTPGLRGSGCGACPRRRSTSAFRNSAPCWESAVSPIAGIWRSPVVRSALRYKAGAFRTLATTATPSCARRQWTRSGSGDDRRQRRRRSD